MIPGQQHHILQRGIDGRQIFQNAEDFSIGLKYLQEAARQFHVAVHAYVLMPDHLHVLATPVDDTGLSKMMQWLGRHYVPYYNNKYQRSGTLWQGRYKATVIESAQYFLPCLCYIESNPYRAGVMEDMNELASYVWSSYPHHIGLKIDPLITDHPLYWALGNTPFQREAAYKELMQTPVSQVQQSLLIQATQKAWLLGSPDFLNDMKKLTDRRVMPAKRGRPSKPKAESSS